MGKGVKKEAMQLGLTNLPKYTFYCQPKKVKSKASKIKPDIAYVVENWMTSIDPSTKMSESGGRTSEYFYLAPGINTYVVVTSRMLLNHGLLCITQTNKSPNSIFILITKSM